MNGWQRLGVVVGTLIAVPSVVIAYEDAKNIRVYQDYSLGIAELRGADFANAVYMQSVAAGTEVVHCADRQALVQQAYDRTAVLTCARNPNNIPNQLLWPAVLPFVVVFGVGYTIAWVRNGFQRKPE